MNNNNIVSNDGTPKEGWAYLYNSPKCHYFEFDGRSLCKRWLYLGKDYEQSKDEHPDNCKSCMQVLAKRKAKQSKEK